MNIAVIGGGSIGLLVGYYLSNHHHVTMFVKREEQRNSIQLNNINLKQASTLYESANVNSKIIEDIDSQFDLYIVCVKQIHLKDTLTYIEKLSYTRPFLFLQNGMGHIEMIQSYRQPIYIGVVSHGAHRLLDNEVSHLGNGTIKIASLTGTDEQLNNLIHCLNQKEFQVDGNESWENLLKQKLIINAVINPITALFDVPNGEILINEHLYYLAKKVCEETATVLEISEADSWTEIVDVAERTKENISSMRADVQQKSETEIEAITGYIIKQASTEIPYTNFIYRAILALDDERV